MELKPFKVKKKCVYICTYRGQIPLFLLQIQFCREVGTFHLGQSGEKVF